MTLPNNSGSEFVTTSDILDCPTSNWDSLYCTHLWTNSHLRNAIINTNPLDGSYIKYCYTCRGKIRKYEVKGPRTYFVPTDHSTPNGKIKTNTDRVSENSEMAEEVCSMYSRTLTENPETSNTENVQCIPTISRQIDTSFRHKYIAHESLPQGVNQRLRKSLKGIGCVISLALNDSPVKKRTQIQACSISVMIVAIIVISFILVNFTGPNFKTTVINPISVPTLITDSNVNSSMIKDINNTVVSTIMHEFSTIIVPKDAVTENIAVVSDVITKIRKYIRTYPKKSELTNNMSEDKPKEKNNRDLSRRFCSCQTDEVCMLDESTGTAICKKAIDKEDPTGCGGLCALETEACQLVDRARGVRVCRTLAVVTCSAHEWRCRNGLCVAAEARCDGRVDCYDRSDEMYCECDLTKQFRCGHSISCFSMAKQCDGVIDCWDGYDEHNCTTECPEDQFTCTDGQCIVSSRFCDSLADCADASDEPHGCGGDCATHELRCRNHRCVPLTALCDRVDHCGDFTDETNCS